MKCIENIKLRYAAPLGATLDEDCEGVLILDAPSGYEWTANGCTSLAAPCSNHSQTFFEVACRDLAERARMGLDLVTDPATIAMYRHEKGDDTWGAPAGSPVRIDSTTQLI